MKKLTVVLLLSVLLFALGYWVYIELDTDKVEYTVNDTLPDGEGKKARQSARSK